MDSWMLTSKEMGDKLSKLWAYDRDFVPDVTVLVGEDHEVIAQAQADKMIRAGFKSPEEWRRHAGCEKCPRLIEVALNERSCMAAEGWSEPGEVAKARQEALREVGEWLNINCPTVQAIHNLRAGRMPEGK